MKAHFFNETAALFSNLLARHPPFFGAQQNQQAGHGAHYQGTIFINYGFVMPVRALMRPYPTIDQDS